MITKITIIIKHLTKPHINPFRARSYNTLLKKVEHLKDKYTLMAGDGTVIKCSIRNLKGTNMACMTVSSLINMFDRSFYNYKLSKTNTECETLLNQPLTKKHLVVLDRGYADVTNLCSLDKKTNFVVRIKKNFLITKEFLKKDINSDIITVGNTKLKLVKYYVDKKTRKIIIKKYAEDDNELYEDNESTYIIATNVLSLTINDCITLYKLRWEIEVAFKHLKTHFKIRHICKEPNMKIDKLHEKNRFWLDMSFLMYNMTNLLKNAIDFDINSNCRFSKIANFLRYIMQNKENNSLDVLKKKLILIGKRFQNNTKNNSNVKDSRIKKKRGRYPALNMVIKGNEKIQLEVDVIK